MGETTNPSTGELAGFLPTINSISDNPSLESVDVASKDLLQMFQRSAEELGKPQGVGQVGGQSTPTKRFVFWLITRIFWVRSPTPTKMTVFGSGNWILFQFSSPIWGRFPFSWLVFFQMGWNHQQVNFLVLLDFGWCFMYQRVQVWFWQMWQWCSTTIECFGIVTQRRSFADLNSTYDLKVYKDTPCRRMCWSTNKRTGCITLEAWWAFVLVICKYRNLKKVNCACSCWGKWPLYLSGCNHRFSTQLFHVWDRCLVSLSILGNDGGLLEAILLSPNPIHQLEKIERGISKIGFHFKRSWFGIGHHSPSCQSMPMLSEVWNHALLSFGNRSEGRHPRCWFLRVVSLPKIGVVSLPSEETHWTHLMICVFWNLGPVWVALVHLWWTCT